MLEVALAAAVADDAATAENAAVAGDTAAAGNPDEFDTECFDEPHQGVFGLLWHRKWNRPTANANGTTGWAEILESTNTELPLGKITRVHLCTFKLCRARYPPSKYGLYSVPIHMHRLTPGEAAAVERALAPLPHAPHVEPTGPVVVPYGVGAPMPAPTDVLPEGGKPEHVKPDASPPNVLPQV